MGIADYILIAVIAAAVFAAWRHLHRRGSGCGHCGGCENCGKCDRK